MQFSQTVNSRGSLSRNCFYEPVVIFFFYDLSDRFLIGLSNFSSFDRANDCPFLCDASSFQYICPANLIEGFDQPNDKHSFDETLQITVNSTLAVFIESHDGLITNKMTWIFIFY